jgi:membrane-bound lytic murein transglycosylase D
VQTFSRNEIFADADNRISDQFDIPEGIRDRVGFWFDVYTNYGYHHRVIHHGRYPWIVFKVVDVSSILNADNPRARWLREKRANDLVVVETRRLREAARTLSRKSDRANLTDDEKIVADALSVLGGSRRKNAAKLVQEMRVQTGQRDFFTEGLEVSGRYLVHMEEIFKRHGLPTELTRIPFVESSFNKVATSKAGAAGVWQFIDVTGRKYMKMTSGVDERRSPLKSTEAAARLLKENHMILHRSWPLAITAYNHGPGGVRKAVRRMGTKDIAVISNRHETANYDFASQNYYSEFLAALYAEKYSAEIWGDLNRQAPIDVQSVALPRSLRARQILELSGLDQEKFLLLNPDLKRAIRSNNALPRGFRLMLPSDLSQVIFRGPQRSAANERNSSPSI